MKLEETIIRQEAGKSQELQKIHRDLIRFPKLNKIYDMEIGLNSLIYKNLLSVMSTV